MSFRVEQMSSSIAVSTEKFSRAWTALVAKLGLSNISAKTAVPSSILAATLTYVLLCSSLRNRRVRRNTKKRRFTDRQSLATMTNDEAQSILSELGEWEFPLLFKTSLQFALFKTYAIPTISGLLAATRQLSTKENASKRYEDTNVLIGEFMFHAPSELRTQQAIARMNYLHNPYLKSGKISQDDFLYTLSVFITEPIKFINSFEWRQLTEVEVCAIGAFWKSIGDAMGIEYDGRLKQTSWKDGIEFYEDIKEWAEAYETKHMVPTPSNKQTADELVPLLLYHVPNAFMPFARQAIGVVMGDRLRHAMSHPEPSPGAHVATYSILLLRRFVLRWLTLPRFKPLTEFTEKNPKTGRYQHTTYLVHPFYNKPTFSNRWGPIAWLTRALGGFVPGGSQGKQYFPEGYKFDEVGPNSKRGQGTKELEVLVDKVQHARPAGCPFGFK